MLLLHFTHISPVIRHPDLNKYFKTYLAIKITRIDKLSGMIIYPMSDLIAQVILGDVSWLRIIFVTLLGRFVYAIEIPKWFGFLSCWHKSSPPKGISLKFWVKIGKHYYFNWLTKTLGATLWFNPFWIARHMIVLELANIIAGKTNFFSFLSESIYLGSISFVGQFPIAMIVNYIIICRLSDKSRFIWSSIFSGLLAIYYAIGRVYF